MALNGRTPDLDAPTRQLLEQERQRHATAVAALAATDTAAAAAELERYLKAVQELLSQWSARRNLEPAADTARPAGSRDVATPNLLD